MSADNDSAELEALFDTLAGGAPVPPKAVPTPVTAESLAQGDDAELEALFDQVAAGYTGGAPAAKAAPVAKPSAASDLDDIFFDAAPSGPASGPQSAPASEFDGLFFENAPGLAPSAAPPAAKPASGGSDLDELFFENAPGLAPAPVAPKAAPAPAPASDFDDLFFASAPGAPASVSAAAPVTPVRPAPTPAPVAATTSASSGGDSDDLESLFDHVSSNYKSPAAAAPIAAPAPAAKAASAAPVAGTGDGQAAYNRIGHMARELHDTLSELGYDKMLEDTVAALPDAKDRLTYVANLTEQAACRVLNATDIAKPVVDDIESTSRALGARWDAVFANQMNVNDFKALAEETRSFLKDGLPRKAEAANAQLLEIMMAQDFQDLTGQVIKKIVTLAQGLESGLMAALVDLMPTEQRSAEVNSLLNGPVISPGTQKDVVVNQEQVDDLLDSLGF